MFDNLSERIAGPLLLGLDAAVEFATLGEVRLVEYDPAVAHTASSTTDTTDAAPLTRRPPRTGSAPDPALLPSPSTALARAALPPAVAPAPKPTRPERHGGRIRTARPAHGVPATPKRAPSRVRAGAVDVPVQLCLIAD
jgi:hypothetical protein